PFPCVSQLVNCTIKTLGLISTARPSFMQCVSVKRLSVSKSLSPIKIDLTPVDDPSLKVQHHEVTEDEQLSSCPAGQCTILGIFLELALSYYLLSDELLLALSSEKHIHLEHLRIADTLSHHQKNQLGGFGPTLTQGQHRHVFLPYMRSLSPSSARRLLSPTCTLAGQLLKRCWPLDDRCKSLTAIRVSECEVTCIGFMEFVKISNNMEQIYSEMSMHLGSMWFPDMMPTW
uniref:F-box and leucine-rich repeat protein 3, like n=1 Tax=Sander lucioperca TaxID=283035 RepID=A0A8D0CRE8_SANLU